MGSGTINCWPFPTIEKGFYFPFHNESLTEQKLEFIPIIETTPDDMH